jgi:hypothetical protein
MAAQLAASQAGLSYMSEWVSEWGAGGYAKRSEEFSTCLTWTNGEKSPDFTEFLRFITDLTKKNHGCVAHIEHVHMKIRSSEMWHCEIL